MANKRSMRRLRKSLRVRLHWQGVEYIGMTVDLSAGGMLISTARVIDPGSHVHGILVTADGIEITFAAQIRWAHQADKRIAALAPSLNRMGARFDSAPCEAYYQVLNELWKRSLPRARTTSIAAR